MSKEIKPPFPRRYEVSIKQFADCSNPYQEIMEILSDAACVTFNEYPDALNTKIPKQGTGHPIIIKIWKCDITVNTNPCLFDLRNRFEHSLPSGKKVFHFRPEFRKS